MSVEIYIDNQRLEVENKTFKTLGLAIKEANSYLVKNGKVATHIYVNGKEFSEKTVMDSEKNIIEFKTKTESSMLLEGIYIIKNQKNRYFELIEESDFEEVDSEDTNLILQELVGITNWTLKQLIAIKENSAIDMIDPDFSEDLEEFKEIYTELKNAFDQGDSEMIWDILEYDISNMLMIFGDKTEIYSKYLIEEQSRSRFLS